MGFGIAWIWPIDHYTIELLPRPTSIIEQIEVSRFDKGGTDPKSRQVRPLYASIATYTIEQVEVSDLTPLATYTIEQIEVSVLTKGGLSQILTSSPTRRYRIDCMNRNSITYPSLPIPTLPPPVGKAGFEVWVLTKGGLVSVHHCRLCRTVVHASGREWMTSC